MIFYLFLSFICPLCQPGSRKHSPGEQLLAVTLRSQDGAAAGFNNYRSVSTNNPFPLIAAHARAAITNRFHIPVCGMKAGDPLSSCAAECEEARRSSDFNVPPKMGAWSGCEAAGPRDVTNASKAPQTASGVRLKRGAGQFAGPVPWKTDAPTPPAPDPTSTHPHRCLLLHESSSHSTSSFPSPVLRSRQEGGSGGPHHPSSPTGPGTLPPGKAVQGCPTTARGPRPSAGRWATLPPTPAHLRPSWLAATAPCTASSPACSKRLSPFIAALGSSSSSLEGRGGRPGR